MGGMATSNLLRFGAGLKANMVHSQIFGSTLTPLGKLWPLTFASMHLPYLHASPLPPLLFPQHQQSSVSSGPGSGEQAKSSRAAKIGLINHLPKNSLDQMQSR